MSIKRKLKVLVIDDSLLFRETIAAEISKDPSIEVVGKASGAADAMDKIPVLGPDVLVLDVEMPKINGIEFLKKLMPQYPMPVVVCSSISGSVFDALKAGAVDFVTKPGQLQGGSFSSFISELQIKIKIASTARLGQSKKDYIPDKAAFRNKSGQTVIAIGASTGGTEAIFEVLKAFPRDTPGIVIVQHMPPVFTRMYAERLNNSCRIEVVEAKDNDRVLQGRALIAPGGFQMELKKGGGGYFVHVRPGEKVNGHCPSVDVLFDSVAETAGADALGIILTGMGGDGAKGLLKMRKSGAYTIGQDETSCVVYGMPMVAYNIGAVVRQVPLGAVAKATFDYLSKTNR